MLWDSRINVVVVEAQTVVGCLTSVLSVGAQSHQDVAEAVACGKIRAVHNTFCKSSAHRTLTNQSLYYAKSSNTLHVNQPTVTVYHVASAKHEWKSKIEFALHAQFHFKYTQVTCLVQGDEWIGAAEKQDRNTRGRQTLR